MKNVNLFTILFLLFLFGVKSMRGQLNVGSTAMPSSTLNVNGSFAATYLNSAAASVTLDASNFYYAYNGNTPGTVTLPAAISGTGNFRGRMYYIKNTGTSLLTIQANGSELIDNQNPVGLSAIAIQAGYVLQVVSKGTTSGTTWEVVLIGSSIPGSPASVQNYIGATEATVNAGSTVDVPEVISTDITPPIGQNQLASIILTGYSINSTAVNGVATQGVFAVMQSTDGGANYTKVSSGFSSSGDGGTLENLPHPTSFITLVNLVPGTTYKFKIQYTAWSGSQKVNANLSTFSGYNGDNQAAATRMTIVVYNR